ncbi:GntR family transcriptional regulator [Vibrio sp. ZSDZ34]|uniref:GntR family transcriptional regulator n=1 Tax=Vibrio gelatinilyticus TaxID=2893468 RepID=A0A9X2AW79_9VIBR|nr:GntR family transcriptional regulator [Vibrio gelatinilyticus]MCJ2377649.1 GntR family transcriptional regulator [Vibrio gelatinilyticus]
MSRFGVYQKIKDLIINRELKDSITETEISKKLETSRTPVREALTLLMHEGWIISKSERVKVVSEVSFRELKHIYQIRADIEVLALKLAWPKLDKNHISEFIETLNNQSQCQEFEEVHKLDRMFHDLIYKATDNTPLIGILTHINDRLSLLRDDRQNYYVQESNKEHLAIAEAIMKDDFDLTAETLKVHISNSYNRLIDVI